MSKMYRFIRTEVAHVCPKQSHIKQYEKKKKYWNSVAEMEQLVVLQATHFSLQLA